MSWKPRPGWVVVEPIETVETFANSPIIIPEATRDRTALWQYTVIRSGPPLEPEEDEERFTPSFLAPGDWILTRPRSAMHVEAERLYIVPEELIWAKLG